MYWVLNSSKKVMGLRGFFVIFCQNLVKIGRTEHHQYSPRNYPLEHMQLSNYKDSTYIKSNLKQSCSRQEETK